MTLRRNHRTAMEIIDIDTISSLQTHLSNLTGLYLSLYGDKGNIILPPVNENKLLSFIRSSREGKDKYREFTEKNIINAAHRNDVSVVKCPAGQYHFFIPVHIDSTHLIFTGGGVYLSAEDFENFFRTEGPSYGLNRNAMRSWYPEIRFKDYSDLQETARHIYSLLNLLLRNSYKNSLQEKRYRLLKTIISLISDIKIQAQADDIYDILIDVILFLFNADSISLMLKENDVFRPRKTAGRLKDHLQSISLMASGPISGVLEKQRPLYSESAMDILRSGFSDEVTSIYAFPMIAEDKVVGILSVFNSEIDQENADIIFDMCKIAGFIFKIIELQETYERCLKEMDILNTAAAQLTSMKEPDILYEAILDTSVNLASAEKGSLMLASEDTSFLIVKAAKGIHKRLLGEIKVKAGEGIAGWVFKKGMPLVVDDIEKNEWGFFRKRPKYRTGSFISIPLKIGEKTIGVLNISDKITGEVFSEEDMTLLRSFASYATIALERSNYYSLAGHLKELSITDSLTGLFNRRYFEERFFEEIHRSDRHTLSFSLAMIDIDDFKLFNDTEGHLAGDEVLKCIANISKDSLRVIDVIARFGGEEFAVIMPQTEKSEAFMVAERIRKSVKEQLPCTWDAFPAKYITVSIGIATYPSDGRERKDLIRNADKALYMAKMDGKDRTVLWGS